MLKNSSILFFLFAVLCVTRSVHGWEFDQNVVLEGVLKRAERIITTSSNDEKTTRIERGIVLVTDEPLALAHSLRLGNQPIASTEISYSYIRVSLPEEFISLIGKRVECSGNFQKTWDCYENEIILDVDTALECAQPHEMQTLFYEPEEVEVSGLLHESIYPGPPEYMSVENGDSSEKVVILALEKPINVAIKSGKGADGDFNVLEKGVRELQVVFSDSVPSMQQMKEEVILRGTLYHAETAHHRRRVLMMVRDWSVASSF